MNWFNSSQTEGAQIDWQVLETEAQLEDLIQRSFEKPVAIFKHSVRCGISAMVKAQLEATWDLKAEDIEIYYLDLIQFRSVSNLIADRLGVWHQSPQLILLKEGKATYNASHQAIRTDKVREALSA